MLLFDFDLDVMLIIVLQILVWVLQHVQQYTNESIALKILDVSLASTESSYSVVNYASVEVEQQLNIAVHGSRPSSM